MMAVIASAYPRTLMSLNGTTVPDTIPPSDIMPTRDIETDDAGNVFVTYKFNYVWLIDDPLYPGHTIMYMDSELMTVRDRVDGRYVAIASMCPMERMLLSL